MSINDLLRWSIINAGKDEDAPSRPQDERQNPAPIDPKWIDIILGKPDSVRMRDCMKEIRDTSLPLEVREQAFDELEMLVESIDNANNMKPLNLWMPLLECLSFPQTSLREFAAWVMGTCVQNNPQAGNDLIEANGIEGLVNMLETEMDDQVLRKVIYALSGLLNHNATALQIFNSLNGFSLLCRHLYCPSIYSNQTNQNETSHSKDISISTVPSLHAMKIVFLLTNQIQSHPELVKLWEGNGILLIGLLPNTFENVNWDLMEKTLKLLSICVKLKGWEKLFDRGGNKNKAAMEEAKALTRVCIDAIQNEMGPDVLEKEEIEVLIG